MSRNFRRFWPLHLACACWLLVFLVPATRRGVDAAWSNRFGGTASDSTAAVPKDRSPEIDDWEKRFPGNKKVELYAAARFGGAAKLVERYPNDATIITVALRQQMDTLGSDRYEGPLSNATYPTPPNVKTTKSSPRAQWNRFLALAARGQKLEPNNSYFTWMRLYGLLATRQDDLARAELARGARLSVYNDHSRDIALNYLDVTQLTFGSPLSPRELIGVWDTNNAGLSRLRQTARWVMETVIADRQNGQHARALGTAIQLVNLGRVMRREGYTLVDSMVGSACQSMALSSVQMPPKVRGAAKPRPGAALSLFQTHPRMLYFYAKSQNRGDITRYLDAEWVEMGKWRGGVRSALGISASSLTDSQTLLIIASERFAVLCVRALPSILIAGAFFALLARRFRVDSSARGVFWRGAALSVGLLLGAMICDAAVVYQSAEDNGWDELSPNYFGTAGLFTGLEWWIHVGLAGAMICFGLNRAVAWQKRQHGGQISLQSRLKTVFNAPEDGLARFDFGWGLELVARATGWVLLLGGTLWFCLKLEAIRTLVEGSIGFDISHLMLGGALFLSIFLSLWTWRRLPRRRATLRASCRFIAGALAGFFVTTSVIYTFVAFAVLPLAFHNEARFERETNVGELAMARAKVGF